MESAFLTAGISTVNAALFRAIRFLAPDPAALLEFPAGTEIPEAKRSERVGDSLSSPTSGVRLLILRDIENERAQKSAVTDFVAAPADFQPPDGLSGDRETATAEAVAEAFVRRGIKRVIADRTLPLLFADALRRRGIETVCDPDRGVLDRRSKDASEVVAIRRSQAVTESAIETVCRKLARADVGNGGILYDAGRPLTSESVRAMIDHFLLDADFENPSSIVAGGKDGGDCHAAGTGPLRTGEPIIVDIYPRNRASRYYGDGTRTVVHGEILPIYQEMADAVRAAKAAATATIRAGVTGEEVHRATIRALEKRGFGYAAPGSDEAENFPRLTHGTGHGLGLDCHEPPLLDFGGPALVEGDVVSVEPGLYSKSLGGIRFEDMVLVTRTGCENLGRPLPETLDWR